MLFFSTTERCCAYPSRLIIWQVPQSVYCRWWEFCRTDNIVRFALARWQTKPIDQTDQWTWSGTSIGQWYLWGIKSFAERRWTGRTEKKKRLRIWEKSFPQMSLTNWKRRWLRFPAMRRSWKTDCRPEDISGFGTHLQRGAQTDHPDRRYY